MGAQQGPPQRQAATYPQQGPQQHYQPPQPATPASAPRNGFGITALALALVWLVFCLMPITSFLGFILGMLGLLFALLELGRVRRGHATNKRLTVATLVLAVLAIVGGFFAMMMFFDIVDGFGGSSSPPTAASGADPGASIEEPAEGGESAAGQTVDRDGRSPRTRSSG